MCSCVVGGEIEVAVIIIDPGHGGAATIPHDSTWNNAVGPSGTLEKNLTLDIGLKVTALLSAAGHSATATRTTDVNLRLSARAALAKTRRADAFVSIHFNGSTNHDAQGTETLVELNHTSKSARLSLMVQDALLAVTGLRDRNKSFDSVTRIKPQASGSMANASAWARAVCRAAAGTVGASRSTAAWAWGAEAGAARKIAPARAGAHTARARMAEEGSVIIVSSPGQSGHLIQ